MANIVFFAHPHPGSVNASLNMARTLRSHGHQVCYAGLSDCEGYVRPQGFEFTGIFETWFPKGSFAADRPMSLTKLSDLREARRQIARVKRFFEALPMGGDREYFEAMQFRNADLAIVVLTHFESFVWALLAHKANLKCVYFYDTLCRPMSSSAPPIVSGLIPRETRLGKLLTRLSWYSFLAVRGAYERLFSWLGLTIVWGDMIKRLARQYGYPVERVCTASDLPAPKLDLIELVLCPKAFDFPGGEMGQRHYIEASIDLERRQDDFAWDGIDDQRPLIYCALGSLQYLSKTGYINFYRIVIGLAKRHPDRQWIIAIGNTLSCADIDSVPPNVRLVNRAPQLDILRRARLMITHGGTNTIKECIYFGVPMVVFPLGYDHYGNAARIVYHGLGVRGSRRRLSVDYLDSLVGQVDGDPAFFARMKSMQKEFLDTGTEKPGIKIIEALAGSPSDTGSGNQWNRRHSESGIRQ